MHGLIGLGVEDHYVDEMCRLFFRGPCGKRLCLRFVNLGLTDKNPRLFCAVDSLSSWIGSHGFVDELALFRYRRSRLRSSSLPGLWGSLAPAIGCCRHKRENHATKTPCVHRYSASLLPGQPL